MRYAAFFLAWILFAQAVPDLASVRAEPNLEKRYWMALEFSALRVTSARKDYEEGRIKDFTSGLGLAAEAVALCDASLRSTGKNPSKSPRHFKRAELKMREILRRLRTLEDEVSIDERGIVAKIRMRIQEIHDELLLDIMGRRK
ncbi:MAG: hypothetical protein HYZ37_03180 [Candidatus Solibacter usitatus]|nr:hypothetical protein [Candidatus Solibacter usitatus]